MGAWIEIDKEIYNLGFDESLPLWERGLKLLVSICVNFNVMSLPLWERGLKYAEIKALKIATTVAPLVGAWIEIFGFTTLTLGLPSRSPCGSVD